MNAVLLVALPVFAVILIGVFAGNRNTLKESDTKSLNLFVFNFAMPAALFALTSRAEPFSVAQFKLAASYGIAGIATIIVSYVVSKRLFKLTSGEAGAHGFSSTLGNAVFLGLPIALAIPGWANNFVVLMLVEGVVIITIGAVLMGGKDGNSLNELLLRPVKNPLVLAMVIGLIVSFISHVTNFALPKAFFKVFEILGAAAGPTALFSLGLFLSNTSLRPSPNIAGRIGAIFTMKMIVLPIMTLGLLYLVGISEKTLLGPAALFTLVPTGVGAFIMASHYGNYQSESASAIAVTTLFSVLTITATLAIFA